MAKYDALYAQLANSNHTTATLTFDEIDRIVGGLPPSACRHRPWWANENHGKHVQARSWIRAGYEVAEVSLGNWVVFERARR